MPSSGSHLRLAPGAEFDLIRRFLPHAPRLGREDVRVGPGDDCAVVTGNGIALSTDLSVEGTHFRRDWLSPHEIGCRAASAALSDLAAMAARPIGVLVSLAVPEADADEFAVHVMEGIHDAVERVGGVVLGGDLTRSPGPVVVDLTVIGEAGEPVLRSGSQVGDEVWVTGDLGAAAVSVARLLRGEAPNPEALERFTCPVPRVYEARWLQERKLMHAMIDLSDGLLGDAGHLATAGGVAVVLDRDAIPVHEAAIGDTASPDAALAFAVSGGEDYELCFSAAAGAVEPHADAFEDEFGVRLTRVGVVEAGGGVWWRAADGGREPAEGGGFQHFGGGDG
ncbi:MAG TPA: thiamine-phosphate kinase [Longimicrobiaceae bacterium]